MHVTLMQANAIIYGRKVLSTELKGVYIVQIYKMSTRMLKK